VLVVIVEVLGLPEFFNDVAGLLQAESPKVKNALDAEIVSRLSLEVSGLETSGRRPGPQRGVCFGMRCCNDSAEKGEEVANRFVLARILIREKDRYETRRVLFGI